MKFGFVIDNRKCIGCHACTIACKSENDVPVGVNRTWVKQTEKGTFPNTRRIFQVSRCNHCTDAPCVSICPTEALFARGDGIVDFNNDRCIGCKSCMQACPYDALHIDPETNTAAKCNYCAHRVDIGLAPSCVNICPEQAIIAGDMENSESEISQLIARQQVKTRKPEKGTKPNIYYIDGDETSLVPTATKRSNSYIWGSQSTGVGHFAKYAEKLTEGSDLISMVQSLKGNEPSAKAATYGGDRSDNLHLQEIKQQGNARRVYDTPDKGVLWGWEVSTYIFTKAIATGLFLLMFLGEMLGMKMSSDMSFTIGILSLVFLTLTGIFLIMDLDQPKRFLYVLLRPHWESWLVKGGYFITFFGGMVTAWLVGKYFGIPVIEMIGFWGGFVTGVMVAVYTAFLFAQAKGRDFWQSPSMALHMLVHSAMAGAALIVLLTLVIEVSNEWMMLATNVLIGSLVLNVLTILVELTITHPTQDAKLVVKMILSGRYANLFWIGVVIISNLAPLGLLFLEMEVPGLVAAILSLFGIFITEKIWIEAPQRISLT